MLKAVLAAGMLALSLWSPPATYAGEGVNPHLKILYAGDPGGPREKAWVGFLRETFETVDSISLTKLNAESAAGYDVVVADWVARYKHGEYDSQAPKHGASLTEKFTKPIIMIGAVGAELTRKLKLKTDWL